jgi:hypothetical protein
MPGSTACTAIRSTRNIAYIYRTRLFRYRTRYLMRYINLGRGGC